MGATLELRDEGQAGVCGERRNCMCKGPVVSVVTAQGKQEGGLFRDSEVGAHSRRVRWGRAGAVGRGGRAPQAILGL